MVFKTGDKASNICHPVWSLINQAIRQLENCTESELRGHANPLIIGNMSVANL